MGSKLAARLFILVMVFAVTACSGGESGSPPSSPPPPITTTNSISGTTVPGATITASGQTATSTTADASGNYVLSNLAYGDYTIVPSLGGYVFAPTSTAVTVSAVNPNVIGINFTGTLANVPTYSISGAVSGGVQSGVLISLSPGNASTVTDALGNYVLSGVVSGSYTVTPSRAGHTFTPASAVVTVGPEDVRGVNFVEPVPILTAGKLLYPCLSDLSAICTKDLSTGVESVVWGGNNIQQTAIVPFRGADQRIAYGGANINGIWSLSLQTLAQTSAIPGDGFLAQDCSSSTSERVFDTSTTVAFGDIGLISSPCFYPGAPLRTDIFAVRMDGSLFWLRVTDDASLKYSPVFGGQDPVTGYVAVLYFKVGTNDIWQQIINPAAPNNEPSLIGGPTLFANSAMDNERVMTVNAGYTHVAFMKNVNGQSHIVVKPLMGGEEVDLGLGSNPYWALDGSNSILFSVDNTLWAINQDGTGKREVPIPSNLWGSVTWVVFGPAGF